MKKAVLVVLLLGSVAISNAQEPNIAETASGNRDIDSPSIGSFGFDVEGMDLSVDPGDDFYEFANGSWATNTEIPADKPSYGDFVEMQDRTKHQVHEILLEADPDSAVGRAFASFMDEEKVEALGLSPIRPWLDKIKALEDRSAYSELVVEARSMLVGGPYSAIAWQDDGRPDRYILVMRQDGLGLGDRDMYLSEEPAMAALREAYVAHMTKILELAGEKDARARAEDVMAMETKIAEVHWSLEDSTDSEKIYNIYSADETAELSSETLDLPTIIRSTNANIVDVQISQPSAFEGIGKILDETPLDVLKDQLILRSLDDLSAGLPKAFSDEHFAFFGTIMAGTPEQKPRWERAVDFMNAAMAEEIGKAYVEKWFPPDHKKAINGLVDNMLVAMRQRIQALEWMQPETKKRALSKLTGFNVKVGYPEKWIDYTGLEMKADDLFGNLVRANQFTQNYYIGRIGGPIREWEMLLPPQTVNAYANFSLKEIVFPAAFLQPPFFDPAADDAVNYGAIGAVIAHEISHHFDDQGSKYGETGALADWWTPQDLEAFKVATDAMIAQAESYEILPGQHMRGEFTLGENIADLAGLAIAYDAYRSTLGSEEAPVLEGLTGDQRFFLGWAQAWRMNHREASLQQALLTDPHAPPAQRVWIVRNLDAWYEAFDVGLEDDLYLAPSERIRAW